MLGIFLSPIYFFYSSFSCIIFVLRKEDLGGFLRCDW